MLLIIDSFKIANITPAHKKDKPTDKEHYRQWLYYLYYQKDYYIKSNIKL